MTWDLSKEPDNLVYSIIDWIIGTDKNVQPVSWNGSQITVVSNQDRIIIRNASGRKIAQTDLRKYDYIRELWAVSFRLYPGQREYLAVVANLRSTSRRAMVLVYKPEGSLVYHEILERTGCEPTVRKVTDLKSQQEAIEVKTPETFYLMASN